MAPIIEDDGFVTVYPRIEGTFYYKGKLYDTNLKSEDSRHGGPFDRGSADSYYHRQPDPHYYSGATYTTTRIEKVDMSPDQVDAYYAGYAYNEEHGDKKDWG